LASNSNNLFYNVQRYRFDNSEGQVCLISAINTCNIHTFISGTNGYVVRNLSALRSHESAAERAAAYEALQPPKHREPDEAILEHERKRKVEVKCLELQLKLEDEG
jgi:hypothetical protein